MSSENPSAATNGLSRRKSISSWFNLSTANTDRTTNVSASTGTGEQNEGTEEVDNRKGKRRRVRQGLSQLLHHKPWSMFKRSGSHEESNFESMTAVSDDHKGPALQPSNKSGLRNMSRSASQLTIRRVPDDVQEEPQSSGKKTTEGDASMENGMS
jgi:hypothetical protein